jgi:hypothetical protein
MNLISSTEKKKGREGGKDLRELLEVPGRKDKCL